jgi:hypothetical protein
MSNISKSKKDPEYLKQQAIKKKEYRDKKKAQMKIGENMIAKNDLYKIFENMKTRKDTPLSKISINNYIAKLNKISQLVEGHDFIDYKFLEDTKKVLHALNASSLKSKKDYMTPIIKVLQHYKVSEDLIKNYRNVLGEHKDKEDKIRGDNKLQKQKDKDNAMSLEDINKKYNEYKIYKEDKIDANKLLYKLIVAFYFKNNVILRNDLPNFKNPVPIFLLLKALGVTTDKKLFGDNAGMIGVAAYHNAIRNNFADIDSLTRDPNLSL